MNEEVGGDMNRKKFVCFKCGRTKPDCNGAKNCQFTTKEDRTAINVQDEIDWKFKAFKDSKKKKVGGVMHAMEGYMDDAPEWDEILDDEDDYDGNALPEWLFNQHGMRIDESVKEIIWDLRKKENHACDQLNHSNKNRKMW